MNSPVRSRILAAFVVAGILFATAEVFRPAFAMQQPAPGTCCAITTDCNPGNACVTREGQTCSPYRQANYCTPANAGNPGGGFIPHGGDH